uniref:Ig-like domain-containing protein n=1 Tax=Stegastes partitus TaxID=144197 RepID=A0A3B5AE08_9TELE
MINEQKSLFAFSGCVSAEITIATVGTDVTLTCNYDAQYYGKLPVCWGRGAIPNRGCAGEVIKTDGESVISRLSERYLLVGNLGDGDVSLTIRQVEESDSGMYGCRVEIPGWFNDHKHQLTLTVNAGESIHKTTVATSMSSSTTATTQIKGFTSGMCY